MFQLSVVEHIRLTFGDVVHSYQAHSTAARRLARRAWQMKLTVLGLLGVAAAVSASALVSDSRPFQIAAAILTFVAFAVYAMYLVLDIDPRVLAHRSCAARFWLVCEKYRTLLTEIHDGLLDAQAVGERRDRLIREAHTVYEHAPLDDRGAFRLARRTLATEPHTLTDAEVDRFLPESLQREKPTAA